MLGDVDVNGCFLCASCDHSGSTNDIIMWNDFNLYVALEERQLLPDKYYFIGYEAFTCTQQFLSPWPGRGLDAFKDAFNYWLSHSRQAVVRDNERQNDAELRGRAVGDRRHLITSEIE